MHGSAKDVVAFMSKIDEIDVTTSDGECLKVFNKPSYSMNGGYFNAQVSRRNQRIVFSGTLEKAFGEKRVDKDGSEFIRIGLTANLNLNHFLMAQSFPRLFRIHPPLIIKSFELAASEISNGYD